MALLQMSISGGLMVLVILLIRLAALNYIPKLILMIMWGIVMLRLLLPFSIPYEYSFYSLIHQSIMEYSPVIYPSMSELLPLNEAGVNGEKTAEAERENGSGIRADMKGMEKPGSTVPERIWAIGFMGAALYFLFSYFLWIKRFRTALLVNNDFTRKWLKKYGIKRRIQIRQSGFISSPLTYGVWHPVILLPKDMDWKKESVLEYVFLHEYIHICRGDCCWKLLSTLCLCLHWFNPLVWLMYRFFMRDMELSCDELVINRLNAEGRKAYILALLEMEEKRKVSPLFCNSFSKFALEERIIAMMKKRKNTLTTYLVSIIFVCFLTTVFVTSGCAVHGKEGIWVNGLEAFRMPVQAAVMTGTGEIMQTGVAEGEEPAKKWVWPTVNTQITSVFGERIHPVSGEKKVIDYIGIRGNEGDDVYAATEGTVVETGFDEAKGNYLVLLAEDNLHLVYGHLHEIMAETGARVYAGDKIATVGKTGAATGSFLSFAVYEEGAAEDPMKYFPDELREFLD